MIYLTYQELTKATMTSENIIRRFYKDNKDLFEETHKEGGVRYIPEDHKSFFSGGKVVSETMLKAMKEMRKVDKRLNKYFKK